MSLSRSQSEVPAIPIWPVEENAIAGEFLKYSKFSVIFKLRTLSLGRSCFLSSSLISRMPPSPPHWEFIRSSWIFCLFGTARPRDTRHRQSRAGIGRGELLSPHYFSISRVSGFPSCQFSKSSRCFFPIAYLFSIPRCLVFLTSLAKRDYELH